MFYIRYTGIQMRQFGCNNSLNFDNSSKEHIIQNFLGGRLSSYKLLCKACNEGFGNTIDKELEQQIGMFTHHLGISRQRNNNINVKLPLIAADGELRYVDKKLKPLNELTYQIEGENIVLYENDERFEKTKNKKQKELEKKFKVSYSEYIKPPTKKKYHIQNKLSNEVGDISFGGSDFFRAIAKIAVNYYLNMGYDRKFCINPITFIKGGMEINDIAYFYYSTTTEIHALVDDEVSHLIHIYGDSKSKILYAYVELFNTENAIIVFDRNYDGPNINETYVYDLINNRPIEKHVNVPLRRHHFDLLGLIEKSCIHIHQNRFNRLETIIEKRQLL